MRRVPAFALSLALSLAVSEGLAQDGERPVYPPGPPGVWARVDSELVTKAEVMEMHRISEKAISPAQALDLRIMELAMRERLRSKSITISDQELEAAYQKALKNTIRNNIIKKARRKGFSEDKLKRSIENELLIEKRIEGEVSEEKLAAYFKENLKRYNHQVRLSLITVAIKTGRAPNKALERARALLARIKGGEPFDAVCRENSDDPMAPFNGGDQGWILPRQERVSRIISRAQEMKAGELSEEPLRALGGYHILKVTAERVPELAFKDYHDKARVRFELRAETIRRLYRRWLRRTIVTRYSGAPGPSPLLPQ